MRDAQEADEPTPPREKNVTLSGDGWNEGKEDDRPHDASAHEDDSDRTLFDCSAAGRSWQDLDPEWARPEQPAADHGPHSETDRHGHPSGAEAHRSREPKLSHWQTAGVTAGALLNFLPTSAAGLPTHEAMLQQTSDSAISQQVNEETKGLEGALYRFAEHSSDQAHELEYADEEQELRDAKQRNQHPGQR